MANKVVYIYIYIATDHLRRSYLYVHFPSRHTINVTDLFAPIASDLFIHIFLRKNVSNLTSHQRMFSCAFPPRSKHCVVCVHSRTSIVVLGSVPKVINLKSVWESDLIQSGVNSLLCQGLLVLQLTTVGKYMSCIIVNVRKGFRITSDSLLQMCIISYT